MQRILYIGIALLSLTFPGWAQSGAWYRTQLLQQLGEANQLSLTSPKTDTAEIVGSCKGYPIVAEWQSGIVCHLGIQLFDYQVKEATEKRLCNFAERYLLEELVCESKEEMERKRFDEGVTIRGSLDSLIRGNELLFSINNPIVGKYELRWENDQGHEIYAITFPANWGLISGEHKIEQENGIKNDLMKYPINSKIPRQPKLSRMEKTTTKGVWVYKRGHYMIPEIVSSLYYREEPGEEESTFTLLHEPEHAAESLINLLSVAALAQNYTVEVTQQKYGFKQEIYSLNLGRMISFFLDQGCMPYIGIEESDEEQIVATLVMVNRDWGYNHILQITMQKAQIGKENGKIKATLNAYTPTHNLDTLYYDDQVKEKSTAPKIKVKVKKE